MDSMTQVVFLAAQSVAARSNELWWLAVVAYLLGSIPFGYLIVQITGGGDIRSRGSGNIGATNVARESGIVSGILTLLLDVAKGYLAVWLAGRISGGSIAWMVIAGLAALAGHLFPVWLGFRGGRGVATGIGILLPICWQAVVVAMVIWVAVVGFWRYVSLASISAAAALPLLMYVLYAPGHAPPHVVSGGVSAAMVAIILRHRPNIMRLLAGTEPKFSFRRRRHTANG
jgi:glycerol-3-phosphate acyltransferase PlsY